jgi:hypothetical protein
VIVSAITDGLSRTIAGRLCDVSPQTIERESKKDADFRNALKKAEAKCEHYHVIRIKAGDRTWQSSAWFLQRKWPKRYGDKRPADTNTSLIQLARSLVSATPPPGSVPGVESPSPVQDDPRGQAIGQDGVVREAQAGSVASGPVEESAEVG